MRNSSIHRSNLSDEKIAFLAGIKNQNDAQQQEDDAPKAYKRPAKQKELDILWQSFKINPKEEKSPGVYLLTGFIAGALCMFLMNAILTIANNMSNYSAESSLGQPKFEKKISRKNNLPQIASSQVEVVRSEVNDESVVPAVEKYTVKSGDSMSSIVTRFYGKYDPNKVEKIRQVNNLSNANRLSIGQELIIPID